MTLGEALRTRGRDEANNFLLLRLVAAILVVYGHSFALAEPCPMCSEFIGPFFGWQYSGEIALVMFFSISGFLITHSFRARDSIAGFLTSRALRLLPALVVFTALTALVMGPMMTTLPLAAYFQSPEVWHYMWINATLQSAVFNLPGVFTSNKYGPAVDGTLWTLWIEARFYLMVCIAGAFGLLKKDWLAFGALLVLAGWAVFAQATFPFVGAPGVSNARLEFFFGLGVLLLIAKDYVPVRADVALLLIGTGWLLRGRLEYQFLFPVIGAYLTFFVAFLPKPRLPNWLGDYSYGCYLYGWPVQQLIAHFFPAWGPYKMAAAAIPLALICGAVSWHLIEKRALLMKPGAKRATSRPVADFDQIPLQTNRLG